MRVRQPEMRAPRRRLIRLLSDACVNRLARLNNNFRIGLKSPKRDGRELQKLLMLL